MYPSDEETNILINDQVILPPTRIPANLCANVNDGDSHMDNDDYDDPLFDQAVYFVIEKQKASISGIQRQFRIGYNRAGRLIERMEAENVVSEQGFDGVRTVRFTGVEQWMDYCKDNSESDGEIDMSNVILWPERKG